MKSCLSLKESLSIEACMNYNETWHTHGTRTCTIRACRLAQLVAYLIQRSGHSRDIVQEVDQDQHPCWHLQVKNDDGKEEVAQDEQARSNTVDDVRLQPAEDLVAAHDCSDDCADAFLHKHHRTSDNVMTQHKAPITPTKARQCDTDLLG